MRTKALKAYIAVTQAFFPDLKIYAYNSKEIKLEFENKVNFYQAKTEKLKELISIRKERVKLYQSDLQNELKRESALYIKEQIIIDEMFIMETEADIAAYNYYKSVYIEQVKYHEQTQDSTSKEADKYLSEYIKIAEHEVIKSDLKESDKLQLQGLINQTKKGFSGIAEKNTVYSLLKDKLIQAGIKL